jgi:hypothetical protein
MQDLITGSLIPLTPQQVDEEMKRKAKIEEFIRGLRPLQDRLHASGPSSLPPVADRGPIFAVGEIVEVKGGRFRIAKIAKGKMVLRGLPRA